MITKITNTKEKYADQFKAINAALADIGSEIRINSLEDYFSNVRTIASLTKKGSDVKGKFLIMPLDEPFFEIDANARTIKIPDNFKKNGIAVQNDHWAEILYFKIDRYYDYQDLASLNIFINWEFTPAGTRNNNAEKLINVTKAFAPDPDFEPNYLIFGWVVSREMTNAKGSLKFSITFTDSTVPGLAQGYQLSTLISTVNVNEGLIPAQGTVPITFNDNDFFARITNSAIHSEGVDGTLSAVSWKKLPATLENQRLYKLVTPTGDLLVYSTGEENADSLVPKIYFPVIERVDDVYEEQEIMYLAAEAVTADIVDVLDYGWAASYSTTEGLDNANFETLYLSQGREDIYCVYAVTKDTIADVNTNYYKKDGNQFIEINKADAQEMLDDEEVIVYEPVCIREVDRGGYYTVRAQSTALKPIYLPTEDETVGAGKSYFRLVDETFEEVAGPTGNPKAQGWYEQGKKTCNSPIKYSNKFIYIPNAEIPDVSITRENRYTPENGNYTIDNENTNYNYIPLDCTVASLPIVNVELGFEDENTPVEGIGGICYKLGFDEYVDAFDSTRSIQDIINGSADHSNSEFASIGTYKHTTGLVIDNYVTGVASPSGIAPGDYYIRVFNQKNHTYSVTDKQFVMTLSYPAPQVQDIDVIVAGITEGNPVQLLEQGEVPSSQPMAGELRLIYDYGLAEGEQLSIIVNQNLTTATSNLLQQYYNTDDLTFEYFLQEVDYKPAEDRENNWAIRLERESIPQSEDAKGENLVQIQLGVPVEIPDNDTGCYRIKVVAHYHDSSRVGYTDLFRIFRA